MIKEAPAMTVRQHLGELLNEVQYRHGKVVITKAGKPVAAHPGTLGYRLGKAIRAVTEDRELALLTGIDIDHAITMTFATGAAVAGMEGADVYCIRETEHGGTKHGHKWFV